MEQTKQYSKENPLYEHIADNPFYLFLKKESFFFNIPHYHESLELVYMLKGSTTVHLGSETYTMTKGDAFLSNSEQVHFYENDDPDKLGIVVVLSNKYTHNFRELCKNATLPSFLTNKKANVELCTLLQNWIDHKDRTFLTDCAFANLLLDKLIKLYGFVDSNEMDTLNSTAISFINYIHENYHLDISLEAASEHFGYSKEYFSKKFKQIVGKNFLSFVNSIRLQKAVELLNDPDKKYTFNEVCAKCGFNNSASLYRHLKKVKQANPRFQ